MVHFKTKWIGSLSSIIKFSLVIGCLYLMCQRDSYQIFDRSPISAVTIKVKQGSYCSSNSSIRKYFTKYNCTKSLFDVTDFILPSTENSAVSITTRIVEIEHILTYCKKPSMKKNKCYHRSRCILPPFYRYEYERTDLQQDLCWFPLPSRKARLNYEALDYIIFIKHFVEFTQLGVIRHNLLSKVLTTNYLDECEYDAHTHPLCPKFRLLKILEMTQTDPNEYEDMFYYGSIIEIKISWKCNLDRAIKYCEPIYNVKRLDIHPYEDNPYEPGSKFLISKHFFRPNDRQLHRLHAHIYNLHIIVSVTGEAGRFDLFQTTTSIGSFLGIISMGAIVCDIIATSFINLKQVKYDN